MVGFGSESPRGRKPSPHPRSGPAASSGPADDDTVILPAAQGGTAGTGDSASTQKGEPAGLIPGPDETTLLPQIDDGDQGPDSGGDSLNVKRHRSAGAGNGVRNTVRVAGELLLTFGAIVMLFTAYEIWGVSAEINAEQDELSQTLDDIWAETEQTDEEGNPVPELGDAFARMWAPKIREQSWTLVEGTEMSDIAYAPGRYLDGAYPGEQGNFTLAGHNNPAIFQKIRDLEPGDNVVIETKDTFYIYEVQRHEIVDETQVDVTAPVPRQPGATPGDDDYWLTLFTCHPLWDNYERYVVYSQLKDSYARDSEGDLPDEAVEVDA
ncbi:class E sortase [Haloglycomyces albus]|uniref:class E sortase n=1 Tax=Haloglycomyces albus TaxID=526067 RepID=UPI00046D3B58|nr:class E sortase [Haloglycomyces albus]